MRLLRAQTHLIIVLCLYSTCFCQTESSVAIFVETNIQHFNGHLYGPLLIVSVERFFPFHVMNLLLYSYYQGDRCLADGLPVHGTQ